MCTCLCLPSMQAAGKILIWNMLLCAHIIGGLNASAVVANTPKTLTQKDPHFFKSHWQVSWYCISTYLNLSQPISTYLNLSQPSKYASASAPKSIDRTGRACLRLKGLALLLNCVVHCVHSVHPSEFLCWVRNWHRLHRSAETFLQQAGRKGFPRQWCMRVVLGWKMLKKMGAVLLTLERNLNENSCGPARVAIVA